jgi:hypothetical protein
VDGLAAQYAENDQMFAIGHDLTASKIG